ncbi:MAG: hypothetical protein ACM359_06700 [Bacillota bacterium]
MAADLPFGNAIAWAHIQLRGGWKNLAITTIGYILLVAVLIVFSLRMNPKHVTLMLSGWTSGLLWIQTGILLLFGCGTVNTALRTDLSSRMIESHRIMPVSPVGAVLGYLLGSASQVLCLAFATFLIGLVTNIGAGTPATLWIVPNVVLGSFALFVWMVVLFAGFTSKHGARVLLILFVVAITSRGIALTLCPALLVLTSPLLRDTVYERSLRVATLDWQYAVAMALQAAIGGILLIGASRKYRRDDAAALPTTLSLLLLATWVGTSVVGLMGWEQFAAGSFWRHTDVDSHTQFLSTLAVSILLALFPLGAAAQAEEEWRRHGSWIGSGSARRPMPAILAVALAAGIVMGLLWVAPQSSTSQWETTVRAGMAVTMFLLSTGYVLRMVQRLSSKRIVVVGLWVVLSWIGPFVIDLIRHGASTDPDDEFLTVISTCSPLGTLIQLWDRRPVDTTVGLAVQMGLVVFTALLFYATRRRETTTTAPGFPVVYPPASNG